MHWVTEARHVASGNGPDHQFRPARSCGPSQACATSARTSGKRCSWRRSRTALISPRTGSASIRMSTMTRRVAKHRGSGRRLSRPLSRRADVSEGKNSRGADGLRRSRSSCASIGPDLDVAPRARRRRCRQAMKEIHGLVDLHVELQVEIPQIASQGRSGSSQALRHSSPAMCAAPRPFDVRLRSRRHLRHDGKAYDVNVWSTPGTRDSLSDIRELLIDTPDGGHVRLGRCGRRAHRAGRRTRSSGKTTSRRIDIDANVQRPRSRMPWPQDVDGCRSRRSSSRLGTTPELLGEYAERKAAQSASSSLRWPPRSGFSSSCKLRFGSWRLATFDLPHAAVGAGGRGAGGVFRQTA